MRYEPFRKIFEYQKNWNKVDCRKWRKCAKHGTNHKTFLQISSGSRLTAGKNDETLRFFSEVLFMFTYSGILSANLFQFKPVCSRL